MKIILPKTRRISILSRFFFSPRNHASRRRMCFCNGTPAFCKGTVNPLPMEFAVRCPVSLFAPQLGRRKSHPTNRTVTGSIPSNLPGCAA